MLVVPELIYTLQENYEQMCGYGPNTSKIYMKRQKIQKS